MPEEKDPIRHDRPFVFIFFFIRNQVGQVGGLFLYSCEAQNPASRAALERSTSSHFRIKITTGPRSLPTKKHTKKKKTNLYFSIKMGPMAHLQKTRNRRFLYLCKHAPCSLASQISLIVVVVRTTLIIAIAVVALFVALIAVLLTLAQIFEREVSLLTLPRSRQSASHRVSSR